MKKYLSVLLMVLLITLFSVGCGSTENHVGEAKTPSGSSIQKGRNYQQVINDFEKEGFSNIRLVELDDLITGWLTKEGEVESVSVDGDDNYSADTWYQNDVEVVISYHTFQDETKENSPKQVEKSDTTLSNEEVVKEIFTVENCEELANILSIKAEIDPAYTEFSKKYKGKIIEFNGCIVHVTNHEDYDTRYDILLSAGDYVDENTVNSGPIFKLEDVGVYDLGLSELYMPNFVSIGSNIVIRAEVKEFSNEKGVFELDPLSISER